MTTSAVPGVLVDVLFSPCSRDGDDSDDDVVDGGLAMSLSQCSMWFERALLDRAVFTVKAS